LRIGLAFAKGLAFSENIPLIGIPTLDIVAAAQPPAEMPLAAVLQAGRKRLSVGWYKVDENRWQATDKLENLTLDEFIAAIEEPTWVCGELNAEMRKRLSGEDSENANMILASPAESLRRPSYLAALAWERWEAGDIDNPATLAPFYLHSGDPIPG
jgi:tRNA threonylcarbamoyladenosine biosynthesis protein TsaB